MGYKTIRLPPASQGMITIVTEFGKFRYNRLPMGMCASGDPFQSKLDELLSDIKGVIEYIYDTLVLIKDCFRRHTAQLIMTIGRLRAVGLRLGEVLG